MATRPPSIVVISCAMVLLAAPAAVVSAQAPAGTGASEPVEIGPAGSTQAEAPAEDGQNQQPSEEGAAPIPPMPAGVPAAEAPRAVEEEPAEAETETDPVTSPGPRPAGLGSMRPFGGVFRGAAPTQAALGHTLDLSLSAFGVRAKSDTPSLVDGNDVGAGTTTYGGTSAGLVYGHHWTEAMMGAFGTGSLAYIPAYEDAGTEPWIDRWSVGGNAAITRALTRRIRVSGAAEADYSPYLRQDLLSQAFAPTVAPPLLDTPGLDFALAHQPVVRTTARGSLSYRKSQRGSIEAYYDLTRRDFVTGDRSSYYTQLVGGRYVYRLNQWVGLRAGYGYRTAQFGGAEAEPVHSHELDIGADGGYGRSFSLARRTTFSFQTGSSVHLRERITEEDAENASDSRTRLVLNGSANLVHAWGRTWSANMGARRGISYEVGFREPLLANEVHAGFGGLLAPRLDFTTRAAYSAGSVGFGSGNNGFATSYATASLRLALTDWLAAYGQYFYYHHDFQSGVTLPGFLPRNRDRQGVSVGLTTAIPLIGSRGRP